MRQSYFIDFETTPHIKIENLEDMRRLYDELPYTTIELLYLNLPYNYNDEHAKATMSMLAEVLPRTHITSLVLQTHLSQEILINILPSTLVNKLTIYSGYKLSTNEAHALARILPETKITMLNVDNIRIVNVSAQMNLFRAVSNSKVENFFAQVDDIIYAQLLVPYCTNEHITTNFNLFNIDRESSVLIKIATFNKMLKKGTTDKNLLNKICYDLITQGYFESLATFLKNHNILNVNDIISINTQSSIDLFVHLQKTDTTSNEILPTIKKVCYQLIKEGVYSGLFDFITNHHITDQDWMSLDMNEEVISKIASYERLSSIEQSQAMSDEICTALLKSCHYERLNTFLVFNNITHLSVSSDQIPLFIEQTLFDIRNANATKVSLEVQEVYHHEDQPLLIKSIIEKLNFIGNEENLVSKITKFNREYQQRFNDYDLLKDICDELINSSYYPELKIFLTAYAITYENLQSANLEGISLSIIEFILSALSREKECGYEELQNLRCFNICKHFINSGSIEQLKLFLLNNDIQELRLNLDELSLPETLELFEIIRETKITHRVCLMTDKPLPEELLMIVYGRKREFSSYFYLSGKIDDILYELSRYSDSAKPIASSVLLTEKFGNTHHNMYENYTRASKICYMLLKAGYYDTLKNFFNNNNIIELGLSSFEPLTYEETTKLFEIISQVPKMHLDTIHFNYEKEDSNYQQTIAEFIKLSKSTRCIINGVDVNGDKMNTIQVHHEKQPLPWPKLLDNEELFNQDDRCYQLIKAGNYEKLRSLLNQNSIVELNWSYKELTWDEVSGLLQVIPTTQLTSIYFSITQRNSIVKINEFLSSLIKNVITTKVIVGNMFSGSYINNLTKELCECIAQFNSASSDNPALLNKIYHHLVAGSYYQALETFINTYHIELTEALHNTLLSYSSYIAIEETKQALDNIIHHQQADLTGHHEEGDDQI
ncbi:hypothetical protein Trichorick_00916 [Candidatus Trichorickettsia mobilis]|uniref:Uncharacterized protein n=1 Tax=Candidatus Trichorickettsia mobilis TaxID=1346319 RepID=A0ABZ0USL5_9RICK|nr:hypothetical protein [Candidatus Trichorickettsia mobilis]WPY01023.1 hypothetical protein Trichorick_00916 [Candidatus Trichorickettsia mobilis]